MSRPVILVHGGAGPRTPDRREGVEAGCLAAARVGWWVLAAGGDALSAVVEAAAALEDDPEFNAGRGAALPGSGTVGAVTLDAAGGLAAATSTGSMIGKRPGRVGDTPLIGAGTYASPGGLITPQTAHAWVREGEARAGVDA